MQRFARSMPGRALALLIILAMNIFGCGSSYLAPAPGFADYQRLGLIQIPGGVFNAPGVNFLHERVDIEVDTAVWPQTVGAVFNSANDQWQWTYAMAFDGTVFTDASGMLHDVAAVPNGNAIPGTHWVRVNATTVKTKGGRTYRFDAQGRLDSLSWANTDYPQIKYVWQTGQLQTRLCMSAIPIESCALIYTIALGSNGPTSVIDERSAEVGVTRMASYEYDALGRLTVAKSSFDVEKSLPGMRYEYHGTARRLAAIVNSEGERIEYAWDNASHLVSVTQIGEGNPTHTFGYTQHGGTPAWYTVRYTNPLGGETRVRFDSLRRVLEVQRVNGGEHKTITWAEESKRPSSIVDFDDTLTQFTEWIDDDPKTVVEPSGNVVEYSYAPGGIDFSNPRARPIATLQDSIGLRRSITYDALGRPHLTRNGEGEEVETNFTGARLDDFELASGETGVFTSYGLHGSWLNAVYSASPETPVRRKLSAIGDTLVEGAGSQPGGYIESAYDHGRVVEQILLGATDETGAVGSTGSIELERRSDGRLLRVTRPHGGEHVLEYDALGRHERLRELVGGSWKDTTYEHNALGQLTAVTRPNGMREEFTFDVYGRPTGRKALRNEILEGQSTIAWAYDRIVLTYDSLRDQTETPVYDFAGRIATVTYSKQGETLSIDYDARSRITRKVYRVSSLVREIRTEWDLADRRVRIYTLDGSGSEQDLNRFDYVDGRLTSVSYGNGLTRTMLFDAETGQLEGYRTVNGAGIEVEHTAQQSEVKANPARVEFSLETETPLAWTKEVYWLNPGGSLATNDGKIGRRVFRWQGWRDGVLEAEDRYAWDSLSNMMNDADGDTFTYNPERSRLISAQVGGGSHAYTYDDAGFLTSRDGIQVIWTATGRLTRVGPAGSPLAEIQWDMAGKVIAVSVAGETRTFSLFGGEVEYDEFTQGVGELHLDHVSIPFAGNERRYRHLDSRGNVSFTSDETGAITSHRRYRPFGLDAVYGNDDFIEGEPRGFLRGTELRHDGFTTGLVVLGARILDSDVGRFLSPDPVLQLANQYSYALGNPVFYADSSGGTPVGVDINAVIAETEVLAADLGAMAAKANATAANLGAAAVAVGAIGLVYPPALKVAAALAAASALAAANAAGFSAQAAALGATAAALKAAQTGQASGGRMPPPPQSKELVLDADPEGAGISGPYGGGSGNGGSIDVDVCGPPSRGDAWDPTWMYVAAIMLLASLIASRRRDQRDVLSRSSQPPLGQ